MLLFTIHCINNFNFQVMSALKSSSWSGELSHPDGWKECLQDLLCWGDTNIIQSLIKGKCVMNYYA